MNKFDIIRKRINEDKLVYIINTNTPSYDIIACKVLNILNDDFICEGELPEKFQSIFKSKTFKLKWHDVNKHLYEPNLQHFMVNTFEFQFGWNLSNALSLRRSLIDKKISNLYLEVERLIIVKNNLC